MYRREIVTAPMDADHEPGTNISPILLCTKFSCMVHQKYSSATEEFKCLFTR